MKVKVRPIRLPHTNPPAKSRQILEKRKEPPCKESQPLRIDYLGGYDHGLVELSDVLPAFLYGKTNTT